MCPGLQRWHSGQTVTNVGHTRTQLLSLGLRNQEKKSWNTPVPQDRILWGFIVSTEQPNWVMQSSSDLQYSTLSYKAALLKYADYSWNDSSIRKILLAILIISYSYFSSKKSKHSEDGLNCALWRPGRGRWWHSLISFLLSFFLSLSSVLSSLSEECLWLVKPRQTSWLAELQWDWSTAWSFKGAVGHVFTLS